VLTNAQALTVANDILSVSAEERARLAKVDAYVDGSYPLSHYIPSSPSVGAAAREYAALVERSKVPVLSLVVDAIVQNLFVDGYRRRGAKDNAAGWESWQRNGMDARQSRIHRGVVGHGGANLVIRAGALGPVWRTVSARRMTTIWEDRELDEFPAYALEQRIVSTAKGRVRRLFLLDNECEYPLTTPVLDGAVMDTGELVAGEPVPHGAPHCPVVGFFGLAGGDDAYLGEVWPLIPLQDQVDAYTYMIEMASQFAVHRQRWATGMAIPEDDAGNPVEPFRAAIDRLWISEDSETTFGEFAQTDVKPWLEAREATLRHISVKSQTPPGSLLAQSINFPSAEALAASEMQHQRHVSDYRTQLGESWERAFRLDAWYRDDTAGWEDTAAQVAWRDTGAQSLAAAVDAWGKAVSLLKVPYEATWEKIPGMTDTDLERWRLMAAAEERRKADAAASAMGFTVSGDVGQLQQAQQQPAPGAADEQAPTDGTNSEA